MDSYRFGRFEVRCAERQLLCDGAPVSVGARGFDTLLALLQRRDRVVTGKELFELIWPGLVVEENNLRQQVAALRRVLGPQAIATVPGRGYRFCLALQGEAGATSSASAGATAKPVIAVLPFANLSGDREREYFADGMTQDIINAVSKHRWLTVIARNTMFGYKNIAVDIRKVATDLGAQYVVEGSVRRAGSKLRVTAELIDAANGSTCWSERYDRDASDVFEVQDEITSMIVGQLEPEIGFSERRVARARRADLRAWECFHLGVWHFFRFTAQDNKEALRLLQRSRDMDPSFGEAHAWWAYATLLDMVYWDSEPRTELLDEALKATQQALALDDQNAVFYALKGRVQLARREYESARAENEIAIALNPTLAAAHCGLADTLAYQACYEAAADRFAQALKLSPRDPQRWAFLTYGALAFIFKGDYERAAEWAGRAREIPNFQYWTHAHEAVALAYLGRTAQAGRTVAQLLAAEPRFSIEFAARKLFYIRDAGQLAVYFEGLRKAGVRASSARG